MISIELNEGEVEAVMIALIIRKEMLIDQTMKYFMAHGANDERTKVSNWYLDESRNVLEKIRAAL